MTATLDRPVVTGDDTTSSLTDDGSGTPKPRPQRSGGDSINGYLRWVLAISALSAGAIHFAVAGDHYAMSWKHGTFMAVIGWLQLVWAAAFVFKPSRRVLILGVLGNAAILGVWVMAKVWGVPVGPQVWTPEKIGWQDSIASACEAAIVVLGLAMLALPNFGRRRISGWVGWPIVAGVAGVIGLMSSLAFTPSWATSGHSAAGHGAAGPGHAAAGALAGTTPCEKAMPSSSNGTDGAGHGHRGPVVEQPITDRAVRDQLAQQLTEARAVAAQMATVADAEAAGYGRAVGYVPCIGSHYIRRDLLGDGFTASAPEMLLYDGTAPDSRIVGLSYAEFSGKGQENAPEGFAGPNDSWHVHEKLCIGGDGVVGGQNTSKEECAKRGGVLVDLGGLWMNHVWVVPGWESSWGTFSSEQPDLGGTLGDINGEPDPDAAKKAGLSSDSL